MSVPADILAFPQDVPDSDPIPEALWPDLRGLLDAKVVLTPDDITYLRDLYDETILDADRRVGEFLGSLDQGRFGFCGEPQVERQIYLDALRRQGKPGDLVFTGTPAAPAEYKGETATIRGSVLTWLRKEDRVDASGDVHTVFRGGVSGAPAGPDAWPSTTPRAGSYVAATSGFPRSSGRSTRARGRRAHVCATTCAALLPLTAPCVTVPCGAPR